MAAPNNPIRDWCDQYAQRWVSIGFEPLADVPFRASVRPIFEDLHIARTAFSPGFTFRDKRLVQSGDDAFVLFISQCSLIEIQQHMGRDLRLGHGDTTVLDYAATGRVGSMLGMERIGIPVPRHELVARGARPENAVMQRLPPQLEGLQLLRSYLRSLERTRFSDSAREIIRRHIVDLVALTMVPDVAIGESSLTAVASARLAAALEDIAANCQDPGLSLDRLAHRQRVSPRYLQRLLEMSGMSFTRRVSELRLERAFKLLTDANNQFCRISDVALHVGFSDISHFNRLFLSRFGDTPSGVRAHHRSRQ